MFFLFPLVFFFFFFKQKTAYEISACLVGSEMCIRDSSSGNTNTGVVLTVVPVALAAGALTVSGIVLKKKNK